MLKKLSFNPVKLLTKSGMAKLVNRPCPRCGHRTLLRPGTIHLVNLGPNTPMPIACCYPGCGYRNSDKNLSPAKLHAKQVHDLKVSKTKNYFYNFSVQADDDNFSKDFSNFETPTEELQKAKYTAQRIAKSIADGKIVHSFLLGDTGTGKTHLVYAIMKAIWQMTDFSRKIVFLNMFQLALLHNKSIHNDETREWFDQLLYQIDGADLIVLDDLGREQNNNWNKMIVDLVANDRENKSIIITANIEACKRYSSQTLDRLKEHSKGYNVVLEHTTSHRAVR